MNKNVALTKISIKGIFLQILQTKNNNTQTLKTAPLSL